LHFRGSGQRFMPKILVRRQDQAWCTVGNQRDHSMLQLSGGKAFGMQVAYLFDFQGSLERERIIPVPAQNEEVLVVGNTARRVPNRAVYRLALEE
jgi:hypothetical protein